MTKATTSPWIAYSSEELEALHVEAQSERRRLEILDGEVLVELRRRGAHRGRGGQAFGQYAESLGCAAAEARELMRAAEACGLDARVASMVLAGEIPTRAAAELPRALRMAPASPPEGKHSSGLMDGPAVDGPPVDGPSLDWVERAATLTTAQLRDEISEAVAHRRPSPPSKWVFWMGEEDARWFRRARRLALRAAGKPLEDHEVLGAVSRFFVESKDVRFRRIRRLRARRASHGRRDSSTRGEHRSRHVPSAVRREVVARDQDRCLVPFCPRDAWLDFGHIYLRHADGGEATPENLAQECRGHNLMQEEGWIRIVRGPDGPIVLDREGFVVERRRRPGLPRRSLEEVLCTPPLPRAESG